MLNVPNTYATWHQPHWCLFKSKVEGRTKGQMSVPSQEVKVIQGPPAVARESSASLSSCSIQYTCFKNIFYFFKNNNKLMFFLIPLY